MESIRSSIDACKLCPISALESNLKDISKGHGKLYGWQGSSLKSRFFFVGLNPSYNRFPNLECAFGGLTDNEGTGRQFIDILEEIGVMAESYITNLVKCSTLNNSIEKYNAENCFKILKLEIDEIKPSVIIAMGNDVHNFLITKTLEIPLEKIWHPNYIISYKPGRLEEYKNIIKRICS